MFRADGKADGVRLDSLVSQFFFRKLAVRRGSRMNDKALGIGDVRQKGKDLQVVDKLVRFFDAAVDFKGENRCAALWDDPAGMGG